MVEHFISLVIAVTVNPSLPCSLADLNATPTISCAENFSLLGILALSSEIII
jgi:hypothetical protein